MSLQSPVHNHVKEKLARDAVVASMAVRLVRGVEIVQIAAGAGFDTLYVDLEHSSLSLDTASQICIAAALAGITPFVRVPAIAPQYVSRVLDGGAMGVIAPHVGSAEDAARAVGYAKFPPLGVRSDAGPLPHEQYRRMRVREAQAAMNEATAVVVMVETAGALDRLDEIAAVPGVDVLLVGTNDLCNDLDIGGQYDNPLVEDAYRRVIASCRKHGKHAGVGGLGSRPDLITKLIDEGARYISIGSDLSFLASAAAQGAGSLRSAG